MRWQILLVCLILLTACAVEFEEPEDRPPVEITENENYRPEIPRTHPENDPSSQYESTLEEPVPRQIFLNNTESPNLRLDVPLNELIGEHHPLLTARNFPLLKHSPIRIDNTYLLGYDEEILFDFDENSTGKIIFGKDDNDEIGTFLFFEEELPIMEYGIFLRDGMTWRDIEGRDIEILGHRYVVAETTNTTVVLYGRNVPNNFLFEDGRRIKANSTPWTNTEAEVGPHHLSFRVLSSDIDNGGIWLSPGESISENIGKTRLGSDLLDIRYLGSPMQKATLISFNQNKHGFDLIYKGVNNVEMKIEIVEEDAGKLFFGKLDHPLIVHECPSSKTYCIQEDDLLLLTAPDGRNFILRYSGISNSSRTLQMRTPGGDRYLYDFYGDPTKDARAEILIEDVIFPVRIGSYDNITDTYNISVEQGFEKGVAEIVTQGGFVIRLGKVNETRLPFEVIVPRHISRDREKEVTGFNITYDRDDDVFVIIPDNITFVEDEHTGDDFGLTRYGMAIWLDKDGDNLPSGVGYETDLLIPESDMYGTIAIEG